MGEIAEALKKANAERKLERDDPAERDAPGPSPVSRELPPTPPAAPRSHTAAAQRADATPPPVRGSTGVFAASAERASVVAPPAPEAPAALELHQTEYGKDHLDHHRHLALRVRGELERRGVRSLSVVSALRNEGKTTVACNLAMAFATLSPDRNVALVDLDLRNPSVARTFGVRPKLGVEAVIHRSADLDSIRICLEEPALDIFPAHEPQRAAHELLVETGFADMMRELHRRYSVVVVDTPPTLLVPDSNLILRHVGACVAVANMGVTRVRRFREMLEQLPDDQIIGKILNGSAVRRHQQDYYYAYGAGSPE